MSRSVSKAELRRMIEAKQKELRRALACTRWEKSANLSQTSLVSRAEGTCCTRGFVCQS